jgi:hypothetical protein
MQTLLDPNVQPLDELDEPVRQLRSLLLEMTIKISVPRPELRDRALEACVNAGLLTSPYQTFHRDFNNVMTEMANGSFQEAARDTCN